MSGRWRELATKACAPPTEIGQYPRPWKCRRLARIFFEIRPGEYMLRLRERGVTVSSRKVTIKPGEKKKIDLLRRPKSKIKETALKAVKANLGGGLPVFSERYLGPMANDDLGLWLSLFGASRILGVPGDFRKLEQLHLETFADMKKDEPAVYVLAGFESRREFSVLTRSAIEWSSREVKDLTDTSVACAIEGSVIVNQHPSNAAHVFILYCMRIAIHFVRSRKKKRTPSMLSFAASSLFQHLKPNSTNTGRKNAELRADGIPCADSFARSSVEISSMKRTRRYGATCVFEWPSVPCSVDGMRCRASRHGHS